MQVNYSVKEKGRSIVDAIITPRFQAGRRTL
jgi:hypothetical protein